MRFALDSFLDYPGFDAAHAVNTGPRPDMPHRSYWYLKKYGLPAMNWNLMLKGLA